MAGVLLIVKKKVFIIYLILLLCDSPSDPDELMSSAKK